MTTPSEEGGAKAPDLPAELMGIRFCANYLIPPGRYVVMSEGKVVAIGSMHVAMPKIPYGASVMISECDLERIKAAVDGQELPT